MPLAASEPIAPAPRRRGASRLAELAAGLRDFGRRHRTLITVLGSLATAAILALVLAGRRDEFAAALSGAAAWVLAATVLLQIVALLARSEAWHLTIREAGGTVDRRVLYRASSMGVLGGLLNAQAAVAARIAALRRSSLDVSPRVPTLIAAESPGRERRRTKLERGSMRLVATGGIIGIAVVLGAVLVGQDVAGWIVGLVVGLISVILAALLWSSRQL